MGAARSNGGVDAGGTDEPRRSSSPEPAPRAGRPSGTLLDLARHRLARWFLRDLVRLGDGTPLETIAPEDLESIRRRFPRPKFFVFGHPRSGTTLLARLIRVHPEVHCNWQIQFFSSQGPIPHFTSASFHHWLRNSSNRFVTGWNPAPVMLRACCDVILERWEAISGQTASKIERGQRLPTHG